MGILKNIWNRLFGKSKKQEDFSRGGSIEQSKMRVVYRKENPKVIGGYASGETTSDRLKTCRPQEVNNFCQPNFNPSNHGICQCAVTPDFNKPLIEISNGDDFFVSNDLIEKETKTDSQIKPKIKLINCNKKVSVNSLSLNKEQQAIQYLLKYGSIDKRTCVEKFGLKRLDNLICELRKQGMNVKNETIELHNELGEKTKVNNYRLVTSDGAN